MAPTAEIVSVLFRYYKLEKLSDAEIAVLQKWLGESAKNQLFFDELSNAGVMENHIAGFSEKESAHIWKIIEDRINKPVLQLGPRFRLLRYAAVIIGIAVLTSIVVYLLKMENNSPNNIHKGNESLVNKVLLPGQELVTLTLANGQKVLMNGQKSLTIEEAGSPIANSTKGQIFYSTKRSLYSIAHRLETPVGRVFQIGLSDGTTIWLNALTKLSYPVSFSGNERRVKLEGEAYFEVAHQSTPFIVETVNAEVRVLGTRFNINSYANQPNMSTTLLQGKVLLKTDKNKVTLIPGESANLDSKGNLKKVFADTAIILSWKNQVFHFYNTSYDEIFRQLGRWYDIEVVFERKIKERFTGILPKDRPLGDLLNILSKAGDIKFEMVGNKVKIK